MNADFGRDTKTDSGYSKETGVPTTKADGREKDNRDFLSVYEKVMIPANPIMIGAEKEIQAEGLAYDLVLCPFTYDRLSEKYAYLSSEFAAVR